jgi:hypothetical protein
LGAGLVMVAGALADQHGELFAQRAGPYQAGVAGNELIALPTPSGDKTQMLTVIDPRQQVLGVYQVDLASGKITLLSVRNIHWDLQMMDFNGVNPRPREIQLQLEHK